MEIWTSKQDPLVLRNENAGMPCLCVESNTAVREEYFKIGAKEEIREIFGEAPHTY